MTWDFVCHQVILHDRLIWICAPESLDLYSCVTFAFVTCGGLWFRSFILIMSSVSHLLRQAQMWKQIPLGKEEDLEAEASNR